MPAWCATNNGGLLKPRLRTQKAHRGTFHVVAADRKLTHWVNIQSALTIGSLRRDHDAMAKHARIAIEKFEDARNAISNADSGQKSDEISIERIENDLSSSHSLLGGALLAVKDYAAAGAAYRNALGLVRGASIAVNEGQLHHQIGNCEAYLGNRLEAASRYTAAAKQFYDISMRGYLGNALGEFGNLLVELPLDGTWPDAPSAEMIKAAIADASNTLEGCFGRYPFDLDACAGAHRNFFGLTVLVSFNSSLRQLAFPSSLSSSLLPWARRAVEDMDDIWWDELGGEAVSELESLLQLGDCLVEFESTRSGAESDELDVTDLATACLDLGYWGGLRLKGFTWLALYLGLRWDVRDCTSKELRGRTEKLAPGEKILLRRHPKGQ